jgi:hypothetical protein
VHLRYGHWRPARSERRSDLFPKKCSSESTDGFAASGVIVVELDQDVASLKASNRHSTESIPDARKSQRQISHNKLGLEMHHAKAKRLEPSIAASIGAEPSSVIAPVDLDDEATGGGEKVDDVLAQRDLPSKGEPELRAGKPSPEASFGECGRSAHDTSAFVE